MTCSCSRILLYKMEHPTDEWGYLCISTYKEKISFLIIFIIFLIKTNHLLYYIHLIKGKFAYLHKIKTWAKLGAHIKITKYDTCMLIVRHVGNWTYYLISALIEYYIRSLSNISLCSSCTSLQLELLSVSGTPWKGYIQPLMG